MEHGARSNIPPIIPVTGRVFIWRPAVVHPSSQEETLTSNYHKMVGRALIKDVEMDLFGSEGRLRLKGVAEIDTSTPVQENSVIGYHVKGTEEELNRIVAMRSQTRHGKELTVACDTPGGMVGYILVDFLQAVSDPDVKRVASNIADADTHPIDISYEEFGWVQDDTKRHGGRRYDPRPHLKVSYFIESKGSLKSIRDDLANRLDSGIVKVTAQEETQRKAAESIPTLRYSKATDLKQAASAWNPVASSTVVSSTTGNLTRQVANMSTSSTASGSKSTATQMPSKRQRSRNKARARVDSPILEEPKEPKEPLFAASAPVVLADLGQWISPSKKARDLSHETYDKGLPAAKRVAVPVGQASNSTSSSNPDVPAAVSALVVDSAPTAASVAATTSAAVSALVVDSAPTAASVAATTSAAVSALVVDSASVDATINNPPSVAITSPMERIKELAKLEKEEADREVVKSLERQKKADQILAFLGQQD